MNKIEIPLSNKKLYIGIGCSLLFVALGFWILITPPDRISKYNPFFIKSFGIASILFFGAAGLYGIKKILQSESGLEIDENGIFDNSNASSIGFVKWQDISSIQTEQVMSTKFLLIFIVDPDTYLEKVSGIKRKLSLANLKKYGTPISITSNTLKYDFDELENLINDKFLEFKNKKPNS
jgi:hypothetical protein